MKPISQPVLHVDDMNYTSKAEKCSTNFTIHELNVKLESYLSSMHISFLLNKIFVKIFLFQEW